VPRYDIFISYARANAEQVRPLVALLRDKGYRVFFDQKEILVGEDWKERLRRSVASARCLVLCWSKESAASEYVRYELFRAEGLGRRVLPWLLDDTPLPELITLQGIKGPGPEQVFVGLSPRLGIQLRRRNVLVAMAAVLLCVSSVAAYRWTLRPWSLNGIVREIPSEDPLAGVVVEATTANGKNYSATTDGDGRYSISIPPPQAESVEILFRKDGYDSEHLLSVTTRHSFTEFLKRASARGVSTDK